MVIAPSTSNPIATHHLEPHSHTQPPEPKQKRIGLFGGAKCQPRWLALAAISSGTRVVTASLPVVYSCIPFKYTDLVENNDGKHEKVVKILMINSTSGPGLVFPKGGWENDETVEEAAIREAVEEAGVQGDTMDCLGHYFFKSKTLQDELSPEGLCKAAMFPLLVKEELQFWPEQNTRQRSWLTIPEAIGLCKHQWMKEALEAFSRWYADQMLNNPKKENHVISPDASAHQD